MADEKAAAPPRQRMGIGNILVIAAVFMIMFNPGLRQATGKVVGKVLNPVIGFDGELPVITIMIAGTLMIVLTSVIRHFTTDWLSMARNQAAMRHFQAEFSKARKENNTYRMKILQEKQPEVMAMQQEMSKKQLKNMPMTMIVVIPLFAWMFNFVAELPYWWYTSPWNHTINLLDKSVFPHWILLYMTLSIPLGSLLQKSMKYFSWRNRWHARHPEVE